MIVDHMLMNKVVMKIKLSIFEDKGALWFMSFKHFDTYSTICVALKSKSVLTSSFIFGTKDENSQAQHAVAAHHG